MTSEMTTTKSEYRAAVDHYLSYSHIMTEEEKTEYETILRSMENTLRTEGELV